MGQGMEVTPRQNIMIQSLYVINNMFRDMHEQNWVIRYIIVIVQVIST